MTNGATTMKVHNVHSRDLAAPLERVGALLDSLGGEEDRLWPTDRWPAMPLELDGPLAAGARGGHGSIRYSVDEYEPGRRLAFRFAPGLGLDGTHRFEVEPLDPGRSRLTHTLDGAVVSPKMLALWPIVRRYHDALIEDLLDQAQLAATGRRGRAGRWPLWMRIANGIEGRGARWRRKLPPATRTPGELDSHTDGLARVSGVAVPAVLAAIAALHAAWALGSHWPAASERELAERVLGASERSQIGSGKLPPAPATAAVAVALLGAAAAVRAVGIGTRSRTLRGAAWGVSGVLLARGALFVPMDLIGGLDDTYDRLDLAIYSPLCLALGAGTAIVARSASPESPPGEAGPLDRAASSVVGHGEGR